MASSTSYAVDDMTTTYSSPGVHALGQVVAVDGKEYRFVKNGVTDAGVAGYPAVLLDASTTAPWVCAYDLSDGIDEGVFIGVCMAAIATGEYGWLLKTGAYHTCTMDDAVAVGAEVVVGGDAGFRAATDNELIRSAGVALEASTQADTGVSLYIEAL